MTGLLVSGLLLVILGLIWPLKRGAQKAHSIVGGISLILSWLLIWAWLTLAIETWRVAGLATQTRILSRYAGQSDWMTLAANFFSSIYLEPGFRKAELAFFYTIPVILLALAIIIKRRGLHITFGLSALNLVFFFITMVLN